MCWACASSCSAARACSCCSSWGMVETLAGEPHPSGAKLTPSPLRLLVEDPKAQVTPIPKTKNNNNKKLSLCEDANVNSIRLTSLCLRPARSNSCSRVCSSSSRWPLCSSRGRFWGVQPH